jgi:hypothetical protein
VRVRGLPRTFLWCRVALGVAGNPSSPHPRSSARRINFSVSHKIRSAGLMCRPNVQMSASVGRVQPAVPVTAPIAGSGALPPPYDAANFVDSSPIAPAFLSSLAGRRRFRAAVEPTFRIERA